MSERHEIIAQFEAAMARGLQAKDAALGTRASLASIYRWRRDQYATKGTRKAAPTFAQELSIDAAIVRLADLENHDRPSLLEAFFKLLVWLRWPANPSEHSSAMTVCVVNYVSQKELGPTIDQLSSENQELLLRHIRLDALSRMFSEDYLDIPLFTEYGLDGKPYTEPDYISNITWFLLAYDCPSENILDAVSLNKAYFAAQKKIFRYQWPISHRTFRKVWAQRGASAPFYYVERFHPTVEMPLDPSAPDFTRNVDEIIGRRPELRLYLARCRSAVEMLEARLDSRALQKICFPHFPQTLQPEPITPPSLPILTNAIMREYGMGYKRF